MKRLTLIISALLLAAGAALPVPAFAQALGERFGGLSGSSNEPIDIEADTLEVDDRKKTATFKGNVHARQGGMTLQSRELEVVYTGDGAGAIAGGENADSDAPRKASIKTIHARGKVLLSTEEDQSATSDWAIFDVEAQTVTIGGNVVLTQGKNIIRGDKLVVDLKTGRSRFETTGGMADGGAGRVKGLFMPSSGAPGRKNPSEKSPAGASQAEGPVSLTPGPN